MSGIRAETGRSEGGRLRNGKIRKESEEDRPLISVVTVVYNGARSLEQTIRSVLEQKYDNIEYLIMDGGSTDGTVDILRKYSDRLDLWVSEPDRGIYDAMNKALDNAAGDWIYFLGADDRLATSETFTNIVPCLAENLALIIGGIRYSHGRVVDTSLGPRILLRNTLHHQGVVYNARLFKGWRYDSTLRVVADYELNLRAYLDREKYLKVKEVIAVCGNRGVSLTQTKTAFAETNVVRRRHVGPLAYLICAGVFFLEFKAYRFLQILGKILVI